MWVLGQHDEPYRKHRSSILNLVGNTPLVRIKKLIPKDISPKVEVYAKLESFNPGGSVKDRPALSMFLSAMQEGLLKEGKVVIDATSGNTGIALAMVGASLGVSVELAMPANVSEERKRIIKAYGAKVYLTDPLEGTDGAILFVRERVSKEPEKYVYLDQYNNPANWKAHFYSTGIEIWHQTGGRITHLVAGIGTGGTIMGTGRRLKIYNPEIQVIGVQPAYPFHGIEGLKHIESSIKPGIFDETFLDRTMFVETEQAYEMTKRLALEEAIFAGQSSGAALYAALELAKELEEGVIVVIFPDGGEKYLSTAPFKE
ncbi:cysteine synthase B [Hydrogenobacter thermophilus TK-6]|uniref:Cysteine synthase n=1 Tax=Hydrogenobacter thermophilus (strain DSM 6534 / IAM 12695 / TK-6) TaxID=608538 RepID=D3DHV8_HYDTT|nr:cysteine synthase B [Hydrogenobacter thermophilus]ADO45343.1 cysteine synthase B [Hydrogenobacter thermophilus TK-6]BAI69410.1 cysteine synthase [Hydrogenobacter thermophilus TK-6]